MKGKNMQLLLHKYKKAMIAAALLALFVVGETFAWIRLDAEVNNVLESHTTGIKVIEENFPDDAVADGTVTKDVSFKNEGSADVFLRMAYEEYWLTADDLQLPNTLENGTSVAIKNFTGTSNGVPNTELWMDGGDGWYYYKKILPAGADTEDVLASVTFPTYNGSYEDYKTATYHLYFTVETVQASTSSEGKTPNRAEVNTKATETVFGKTGTIDFESAGPAYNVSWQ